MVIEVLFISKRVFRTRADYPTMNPKRAKARRERANQKADQVIREQALRRQVLTHTTPSELEGAAAADRERRLRATRQVTITHPDGTTQVVEDRAAKRRPRQAHTAKDYPKK